MAEALPKLCQSCFLQDSDVPFSVRRWLRFWSVFEQFARAVPLRFPVLSRGLRELVSGWPRLWQSRAKAVSYRIQTCRFRSAAGLVLGPFLSISAVPLRFPVFRESALGTVFLRGGLLFGCAIVVRWPCHRCPWLCQSSAKGFFLQDSDVPFSVRG